MDKIGLRAQAVARRRARDVEAIESARAALRAHVVQRTTERSWARVAGYVPLRTEPGSLELLDELHGRGARVLVPVLRADADLDWSSYPSGELLGVEAIAGVDAVLVPALAVARDGTRLGRGGGSYDRALARVPPGVAIAALLFDGELVAELPRDGWDVAVNSVVTPSGWRAVGESGAPHPR